MKRVKNLLWLVGFWLLASTAQAALAGKNVLLIQGFLPQHILFNPSDNGVADGVNYWSRFNSTLKDPATTRILTFPSHKRLQGANSIASLIVAQLQPILSSGFCDNQCIVITHSTGDLVMRYLNANKTSLLGSNLASRFKVAAFIDLAGAGGGTELASFGVDLANGVNHVGSVVQAMLDYMGFNIRLGVNPGVMIDLQPSVARTTATSSIPAVPRLRVAASGDELYGVVTHPIIKGSDDSVVPLHSACGAATNGDYASCVTDLRMDGRVTSVSKAPTLSQLYNYHYPVILSHDMAHNEMQSDRTGRGMTFAVSGANKYKTGGAKTVNLNVSYYEENVWWDWFNKYRFITNAGSKTMGKVLLDSIQ